MSDLDAVDDANQSGYPQIETIVQEMVSLATQRDEAIRKIQEGLSVDPNAFAGPHVLLLNAAPGLGKTHARVKAAEEMWSSLPVLHLSPTHDSFENVGGRQPSWDSGRGWDHWQGHDDGRKGRPLCPRSVRASKGYSATNVKCAPGCHYTPAYFAEVPTFAPVDYILSPDQPEFPLDPQKLIFPKPLTQEAVKYPWWAIDDVGLDRFVGNLEITTTDLVRTRDEYPLDREGAKSVRTLAMAFMMVLAQHREHNESQTLNKQENWSGLDLYDRLEFVLRAQGSSIQAILDALYPIAFSDEPWTEADGDATGWPVNFMPTLKPKLLAEMAAWILTQRLGTEKEFQAHIHIVRTISEDDEALQPVFPIWLKQVMR